MIEFARTHIISRSSGHSAIAAAAYRSGTDMYDDRTGCKHNYSVRAEEVAHSEILLPEGAPDFFKDRAHFWGAAELAEDGSTRRSTAQLAKDHIIALPKELPLHQQIEMIREFAQTKLVEQGVGVDLNVHLHSKGNPHAHLMTTTRVIDEYGFGKKARHLNGGFAKGESGMFKVPDAEQMRHSWAAFQNKWCEQRGIDLKVTNNDGEWRAEKHVGRNVEKTEHNQPNLISTNDKLTLDRQKEIISNPLSLVDRITRNNAVFTRKDLQGELFRHITDKETYDKGMKALDKIMTEETGVVPIGVIDSEMRYTSSDNLQTEIELADIANSMLDPAKQFGCDEKKAQKIIAKEYSFFSDEQKDAVKHISKDNRLSVVVGLAGAGKSTMLKAANELWQTKGLNVQGVALAGIAAAGLEEGSGIKSRTLASWQYAMKNGRVKLDKKSVVVMDEAGMVGNKMMLDVVQRIQEAGAKLVLVGDPEQLQAINAGGPLRSVMQRAGYCEIGIVRRQNDAWQRDATKDLAEGRTTKALNSYDENGNVHWGKDKDETLQKLATDTVGDILVKKHTAVLAHTNAAVDTLNSIVRQQLINKGHLKTEGKPFISARGKILLTKGDRVLFRKNDRTIGVQNGSVGTVTGYKEGGELQVKLDNGETIKFNGSQYDSVAHGYAMTIHKSQGVTVDHTRVLASGGYDKHLSYVALSRHRKSTDVYAARPEFEKQKQGKESVTKTFQRIMGRLQIEENAIDFANRHGLELSGDGKGFQFDRSGEKSAVAKIVEETNKHYKELIKPVQSRENRLKENLAELTDRLILAKRKPDSAKPDLHKLEAKLFHAKDALKTHRMKRVESGGLNIATWETANKMAYEENPKLAAIVKQAATRSKRIDVGRGGRS